MINCLRCDTPMQIVNIKKLTTFRGHDIMIEYESYECPICGLIAGTIEQTGNLQDQMIKKIGEIEEKLNKK